MNRSACLPDSRSLVGLLAGLNARPLMRGGYGSAAFGPPPSGTVLRGVGATPTNERQVNGFRSYPPKYMESIRPGAEPFGLESSLATCQSLDECFAAFATWAKASTSALAVFITDSEGLSMVPSTATEDYLAVAAEISSSLKKLSELLPTIEGGSSQLELQSSPIAGVRWVELVGCTTVVGYFTVGFLLTDQLKAGWPSILRDGLKLAVAMDAAKSR